MTIKDDPHAPAPGNILVEVKLTYRDYHNRRQTIPAYKEVPVTLYPHNPAEWVATAETIVSEAVDELGKAVAAHQPPPTP